MKLSLLTIALVFFVTVFGYGQDTRKDEKCACSKVDKATVETYFRQIVEYRKKILECESQSKIDSPPRLIIANKCEFGGEGCPVSLVKPQIPDSARRMRRSGSVKVRVVVDEEGKVIYSRMVEGDKIFRIAAERAACRAIFSPTTSCGQKIKTEYIILYNFLLS
jgi:TonB family protein